MLPTKFRFIWTASFRGKFSLEIDQPETRIAYGGHGSEKKIEILISARWDKNVIYSPDSVYLEEIYVMPLSSIMF
jgi:hypothetical protein